MNITNFTNITAKTFETLKDLWDKWEIRYMLLYSLGTQAILTFLAPLRKRSSSKFLHLVLWLLYLAADSVALATISLIAREQLDGETQESYLIAFWTPFLILHLGGPDTITALQLEDMVIWDRHALHLLAQSVASVYVFARSLRGDNVFLFPTLLVFFDGFIKYIERVWGLSFAASETLKSKRSKGGPARNNGRRLMENASTPTRVEEEEHGMLEAPSVQVEAGVGTVTARHDEDEEVDHDHGNGATSTNTFEDTHQMINDAYAFCRKFKGLLAGSFLSSEDYEESRGFYLRQRPFEALKMLQIEVSFMYDLFYTKAFLLQWKVCYVRIICFLSIIASLLIFSLKDKKSYRATDIMITYILLVGAVALDVSSMLMFLMSDWWVVIAYSKGIPKFLFSLMFLLLKWSKGARGLSRHRSYVSQFNLLERCLKEHPPLLNKLPVKFKDPLVEWLHVDHNQLDAQLAKFVISELQAKAQQATNILSINEMCFARGNLVFQEKYSLVAEYLRPWTLDVDYDESLLTWHFATDICYWTCTNKDDKYVKFSKTLSDYMSYIILHQQELVSTLVGASDIRFDDTRAEAKKFMSNPLMFCPLEQAENSGLRNKIRILIDNLCALCRQETSRTSLEQFCANILKVPTPVRPKMAKGIKSKSVLFDSCRLAKQLKMFGENQWEITSKVWVELLTYAAFTLSHSRKSHVVFLSKGGQLITLVWLLMLHLGFRKTFRKSGVYCLPKPIIR